MGKKLVAPFLLMHHSISTEYRKYDKIPEKHRAKDRKELRLIIKTICKVIGKNIVNRVAGVHIQRLGYFFIWKIPRKMTFNMNIKGGNKEEKYNHHTKHYMYSPIFLQSLDKRDTLGRWSMDNSFVGNVKKGVQEKVTADYKYKMYPYSIMKLNRM